MFVVSVKIIDKVINNLNEALWYFMFFDVCIFVQFKIPRINFH